LKKNLSYNADFENGKHEKTKQNGTTAKEAVIGNTRGSG